MNFFKNVLASLLGLIIFSFLFFFLLIGIAAAGEGDETVNVEPSSILYLKLSGVLQERTTEDPLKNLFPEAAVSEIGLRDLVSTIQHSKEDERIKGIYLDHQLLSGGFASLKEVRDALIDFKASGKIIYAYGEYLSEGDYYLASAADVFFMHPEGSLEFNGLMANITFFKGLFEKLEVKPEIFRVGSFKSAVEPFLRKDMSPENRLQYTSLLSTIYDIYLTDVAESRDIQKEDLSRYSKELKIQVPEDAHHYGLVDSLGYKDELKSLIASDLELEEASDIEFISHQNYKKSLKKKYAKDKIAVIYANGSIVMVGDDTQVVGYKLAKEIRKARENKSVKAIVLRINSPGGSLVASDLIWHEVSLTKGVKPIIASMADVAASGGYYIAMACDTIIAQPNTITGSIGIFGMWFNFGQLLENKFGITHDVVKTGDHSDLYTVTRSLTDFERSVIQKGVNKGYQTFISKAAVGRGVTSEAIDEVGSGRVWSGTQALDNGLIDIIGNFDDAVDLAVAMSRVEGDYRVVNYPAQKSMFEKILGSVTNEIKVSNSMNNEVMAPYFKQIKSLQEMKGIQARMAEEFTIY
jgi:protease-4|tara:strand:- start:2781 stop:4520 length:1740 start_codon:yes stop_codon:yes gene_type:complete